MLGYWNRPEATAQALRGGVYHTGDLGVLEPDGTLFIRGRRNELILRGGANVYPAEVERVLEAHPAVAECAVLRHSRSRGSASASSRRCVLAPGARASAEALQRALPRRSSRATRCPERIALRRDAAAQRDGEGRASGGSRRSSRRAGRPSLAVARCARLRRLRWLHSLTFSGRPSDGVSPLQSWGEILRTQNLSSDQPMDGVSRWLLITRASVFPMTITSGAARRAARGRGPTPADANWFFFALALVGLVLAHAANNMINDYFDLAGGVDSGELRARPVRAAPDL